MFTNFVFRLFLKKQLHTYNKLVKIGQKICNRLKNSFKIVSLSTLAVGVDFEMEQYFFLQTFLAEREFHIHLIEQCTDSFFQLIRQVYNFCCNRSCAHWTISKYVLTFLLENQRNLDLGWKTVNLKQNGYIKKYFEIVRKNPLCFRTSKSTNASLC